MMESIFTDMDCEQVRDVTVISRNGNKEQRIFMNSNGVFKFTDPDSGAIRVMRLPSIKIWVFCSLICDMLQSEDVTGHQEVCWEVCARDNYGRRYRLKGPAVTFRARPKYDPSKYLRNETGINGLWLLDGKAAV